MRTKSHHLCIFPNFRWCWQSECSGTSQEAKPVSSSIQQHQRVFNLRSHGARVPIIRSLHMPQVNWTKAKCKVALWNFSVFIKLLVKKTPTSVYEKTALLTWGQGWSHWTKICQWSPPLLRNSPPSPQHSPSPLQHGNLPTMATSLNWKPSWNGNLSEMKTFLWRQAPIDKVVN